MGYHNKEIKRGVHGEPSKIQEELDELNDALEQDNPIMALLELSDLYLAIEAVAIKLGSNIKNVEIMALATKRAFESGERKSKENNVSVTDVLIDESHLDDYGNPINYSIDDPINTKPDSFGDNYPKHDFIFAGNVGDNLLYGCKKCGLFYETNELKENKDYYTLSSWGTKNSQIKDPEKCRK